MFKVIFKYVDFVSGPMILVPKEKMTPNSEIFIVFHRVDKSLYPIKNVVVNMQLEVSGSNILCDPNAFCSSHQL